MTSVARRPALLLWVHAADDFDALLACAFVEPARGEHDVELGPGGLPADARLAVTFATLDWVQAPGAPSVTLETPHLPAARR